MKWFRKSGFKPRALECPLIHTGEYLFWQVQGQKYYHLACCNEWFTLTWLGNLRLSTPKEKFSENLR